MWHQSQGVGGDSVRIYQNFTQQRTQNSGIRIHAQFCMAGWKVRTGFKIRPYCQVPDTYVGEKKSSSLLNPSVSTVGSKLSSAFCVLGSSQIMTAPINTNQEKTL
ncbi:hypothetical protein BZZ01_30145 [Nostocales cyanobacterium HT-58-2]|nr:hypothetical protein BZZ01_30145 [Nostocales cyanobacterium HT-58-2]